MPCVLFKVLVVKFTPGIQIYGRQEELPLILLVDRQAIILFGFIGWLLG